MNLEVTSNTARELHVLCHDGHAPGVQCTQVCIFEKTNEKCLCGLLQGQYCGGLEPEIDSKPLGDFAHQALKRYFANQKFSGLLVFAYFSQRNCPRPIAVRLLDTGLTWRS